MTGAGKIAVVTGGSGFLARNLIPVLHDDGWRVISVTREPRVTNAGETLTWVDFWRGRELPPKNINAVFHLAAHIPPQMEDSAQAGACLKTNALLTLKLAEHMATKSRARFIHCSSGQVYRYRPHAVTERQSVLPLHRACFYLASKLLGEIYVERTRKVLGLDAITFRVGSCYGPWMPENSLLSRFISLAKNRQPLPLRFGGNEQFDLVHARDVAMFLARAATVKIHGTFNAGSGRAVKVKTLAGIVNRVFGNDAGVVHAPSPTAAVQSGFSALAMKRTSAVFDWQPRTIARGVKDYQAWLAVRRGP